MKSGVKGFWKKQKNVVRRHRPSTILPHCSKLYVDTSKTDFFNNGFFDVETLRNSCSFEVKYDKRK